MSFGVPVRLHDAALGRPRCNMEAIVLGGHCGHWTSILDYTCVKHKRGKTPCYNFL